MDIFSTARSARMVILSFAMIVAAASSGLSSEFNAEECKVEDGCYIVYAKGKKKKDKPREVLRWYLPSKAPTEIIEVKFEEVKNRDIDVDLSNLKDCKSALEFYFMQHWLAIESEVKKPDNSTECNLKCTVHSNRVISILENKLLAEHCKDVMPDAADMVEYLNGLIP